MKNFIRLATACALLGLAFSAPVNAQGNPPFKLLLIGAMSGLGAPIGKSELAGYQASIEDVNAHGGILGRRIELSVEDSQSQGTRAASLLQERLNAGQVPDAVIAGVLSNETIALLPTLTQHKIIGIAASSSTVSNNPAQYPYAFLTALNIPYFSDFIGNYLKGRGYKKVAILTPNDALGQTLAKSHHDGIEKAGLTVVSESYAPGDLDLTAPMQRLADAHPDALLFSAFLPSAGPLILQARDKVGLAVPAYGDVALTADLALLVPHDRLKGVYIAPTRVNVYVPPDKRSAVYSLFLDGITRRGPIEGALLAPGNAWDTVQVLALAFNQAGSLDADKVKAALENLRMPAEKDRRFVCYRAYHYTPTDHFNSAITAEDFAVFPLGPRVDGGFKAGE